MPMVTNGSPKRFLITGGAGFIGGHLCEALLAEGHQVQVIDNLSTGSLRNIQHLLKHPGFQFATASITDQTVMDRLTSQADIVVHLAAAVGVKLIVEQPVHTIETNVMGTESVLQAARRYRCRVLIASTSEVYGKGSRIPFREDDDVLLGPTAKTRWAYAASKMLDEFLALAYQRQFDLDVVLFRLFNTVGPRQSGRYGMVIPRFMRQALEGQPITIYGDGRQTRCFCDVRDVVRALIGLALHRDASGRVFNIGGTEEISIRELAARIQHLTDSRSPLVHVPYSEAYAPGFEDMLRRVPDTSRIQSLLDWTPRRNFDETLRAVMEYEQQHATEQTSATRPSWSQDTDAGNAPPSADDSLLSNLAR